MKKLLFGKNRIIIIAGHYGAGKTNVAVNAAEYLAACCGERKTAVIDLDTVNPYFRAADSADYLRSIGVHVIVPEFANTNVDIPVLPAEISSVFYSDETAIFDVGGDDGSSALGVYAADIEHVGYEMFYIANMYRPLISDPKDAAADLYEIEGYSRLKFTGIINASNLGDETTADTIAGSSAYAKELSDITSLPLVFVAAMETAFGGNAPDTLDGIPVFAMKNRTKKLF
ncbi:MAG: ParA family protein [Firmicutes bacterium]|nr:ParA family protein [Bacillota bacterium]